MPTPTTQTTTTQAAPTRNRPQEGVYQDGRRDYGIYDLPDRGFGVELEFTSRGGIGMDEAKRIISAALVAAGFTTNVRSTGYTHQDNDNQDWWVKTDGSCGYEIASPVLHGYSGLHELSVVLDAMDAAATDRGARLVNRDCGVHVHVDSRDLDWKGAKEVMKAVKVWEPVWFAMNPHSRSGNQFCRPMDLERSHFELATGRDSLRSLWRSHDNRRRTGEPRYHGFNLDPWFDTSRGSIEFRYFAGSFSFEKVSAAVLVSMCTIEAVKVRGSALRIRNSDLDRDWDVVWSDAGTAGLQRFTEKFFRDFLQLRSNACPLFRELKRFVKSRVATFYQDNGSRRSRNSAARSRA